MKDYTQKSKLFWDPKKKTISTNNFFTKTTKTSMQIKKPRIPLILDAKKVISWGHRRVNKFWKGVV